MAMGGTACRIPSAGLFYGDASQFVAQLIGVVTCFVFVFVGSYIFFKILDKTIGMRVSPEAELMGIDIPEVGALAYPRDDMLSLPDIRPATKSNNGGSSSREKTRV